jgi:hypothetical protein
VTAWQEYIALAGPIRPDQNIRIVLCCRCNRMEIAEIEHQRVIRVSYWDDTPVFHK